MIEIPGGEAVVWPARCVRCGGEPEVGLPIECSFSVTVIGIGTIGQYIDLEAPSCVPCRRRHRVLGIVFDVLTILFAFALVVGVPLGADSLGIPVNVDVAAWVIVASVVVIPLVWGLYSRVAFDWLYVGTWALLHPFRSVSWIASRKPFVREVLEAEAARVRALYALPDAPTALRFEGAGHVVRPVPAFSALLLEDGETVVIDQRGKKGRRGATMRPSGGGLDITPRGIRAPLAHVAAVEPGDFPPPWHIVTDDYRAVWLPGWILRTAPESAPVDHVYETPDGHSLIVRATGAAGLVDVVPFGPRGGDPEVLEARREELRAAIVEGGPSSADSPERSRNG